MVAKPRMTLSTQLVLSLLLQDPSRELYGLEVCSAAGLPSGTVHPILARLEKIGWLESWWETVDPKEEGRPRRRYYRLSPDGAAAAGAALARAQVKTSALGRLRPGLTGGA
jgi:PadR family transcriptional regulator PadR